MNYEDNRLRTFRNWPTAAEVDKARVAQCGFFYLGRGLEVQCFACGGKISEWNYGDQAMVRHRELDPQCPFVVEPSSSGNVPIGQSAAMLLSELNGDSRNAEMSSRDDIYKNDALRLLSYVHWPATSPPREEMVLAGFYHMTGERVRCAWCGVEVQRNWSPRDDPLEEHRQLFPQCPFIQQRDQANTLSSVSHPTVAISTSNEVSTNPVAPTGHQTLLNNRDLSNLNTNILEAQDTWESLGVVAIGNVRPQRAPHEGITNAPSSVSGPRNPTYASLLSRLETFRNWPYGAPLAPTALAQAGFYFTGTTDQVRCFYCDGGLGRWEPGDNPWSEHKRWFPRCAFLNLARPDPTGIRNSSQNGSPNPNSDILTMCRSSDGCTVIPSNQTPSLNSIIVARSLGEDVWHDWDWESPSCRQLRYQLARNKPGVECVQAPESHTSSTSVNKGVKISSSGDDQAEAECFSHNSGMEMIMKTLQEENRQLKEAKLCKVCMDDEVSTVFLPCGHAAGCGGCAPGLTHCPLCRADVHALIRAYLP